MPKSPHFATGIGPTKRLLEGRPELVQAAHKAGLTVTPYTFTSRAASRFPTSATRCTITSSISASMPCSPITRIDFPEEGCDAAEKQVDCARHGRACDGDARGGVVSGCGGQTGTSTERETAAASTADPRAEAAENVRLVGYNDLQGRTALVVWTKSDAANGSWVYVGHHESFRDGKPLMNPITGKMEFNGTSVLDIADPSNPKLVWHIPNETNRNSRGVSVVRWAPE